ncbi:glycosyltransferase family 4 protein [Paenibacillus radicis (ex Xue et al. 2023)]|uniref:Glycosyltransferase family 4 protein n=1 Tax=Paenibacillus radicis (ex Xue et al. 2023) TaxID=2972489 RepID=A0ABT1YGT9_9BACL|nr:glycosyltransferase family 4 protein [Paenibacillus radicis (ex Xue et al. 2023)]MCR8632416.1 glycosyltransferase family 4 protein [Paenibacillus radicis (ex Xue et al. 2023)]
MKIAVICHYFYPEIGAPSARLFEMAKRWVDHGHEVSVITCFPNHPTGRIPSEYRGKSFMVEIVEGIKIYRNYVYATPNEGFVKKTLGHLSFMVSSVVLSMFRIEKPDIVIVSSPTLFSVVSGYLYSVFKKTPYIFEVRDLWPDAIVKLGILKSRGIIRVLESLEMFLYHRSKKVVVVTRAFKDQIAMRGIPESKIDIVTNGVDMEIFNKRLNLKDASLRKEFGWGNKKIFLYVGAHGISQGLSTLIHVAKRIENVKDFLIVFVGEGSEKKKLQLMADELALSNIQFISSQPKERIPAFYAEAELSFVPLRNLQMFKSYIPSKMFEILGSGCPIIASLSGEAEEILRNSKGAIIVEPENVDEIVDATLAILEDPMLRENLSENGYNFVKEYYSREALAQKYLTIIEDLHGGVI